MNDIKRIVETLESLTQVYESPGGTAYLLTAPEWPEHPQDMRDRHYDRALRNRYDANRDVLEFLQCRLVNIATQAEKFLEFLKSDEVRRWVDSLETEAAKVRSTYQKVLDEPKVLSAQERKEIISILTGGDKYGPSIWPPNLRHIFNKSLDLITRLYKDRKRCRPNCQLSTSPLPWDHEDTLNRKRHAAWEDLKYTREKEEA